MTGARTLLVFFALVFGAMVIARAPLSAMLALAGAKDAGLSYSSAEGTIWNGRLRDVSIDRRPIGDVAVGMELFPLLTGRLSADVDARGPGLDADGKVSLGLGGTARLTAARIEADMGVLGRGEFLGTPAAGLIRAEIEELVLTRSGCRGASGDIWTDALAVAARAYDAVEIPLQGALSCEKGVLAAPLSGTQEGESVWIDIMVQPDLRYGVTASIASQSPSLNEALAFLGFEPSERGLSYEMTGDLREAAS